MLYRPFGSRFCKCASVVQAQPLFRRWRCNQSQTSSLLYRHLTQWTHLPIHTMATACPMVGTPPEHLTPDAPPAGMSRSPFPRHVPVPPANCSLLKVLLHNSLCNNLHVFSTRDPQVVSAALANQRRGSQPTFHTTHSSVLLIWGGATNIDDQGEFILSVGTSDRRYQDRL